MVKKLSIQVPKQKIINLLSSSINVYCKVRMQRESHLRKLILLTILQWFAFCPGFAQLPADIEFDEVQYSKDSSVVLVKNKNQYSLYNTRTQQYLSMPSQKTLLYMKFSNAFIEISNQDTITFFVEHENTWVKLVSNKQEAELIYIEDWSYNSPRIAEYLVYFNRTKLDQNFRPIALDTFQFEPDIHEELKVQRIKEDLYIINNLKESTGQSIDFYHFGSADTGYANSGVYNQQIADWVIPPVYCKCELVNGYIFCFKRRHPLYNFNEEGYSDWQFDIITDIYKLEGNSIEAFQLNLNIAPDVVHEHQKIDLEAIFKCDRVHHASGLDTMYYVQIEYVTERDKKYGLCKFIFNPNNYLAEYREIIPHQERFIFRTPGQKIGVVTSDTSSAVRFLEYNYFTDSWSYSISGNLWVTGSSDYPGWHVISDTSANTGEVLKADWLSKSKRNIDCNPSAETYKMEIINDSLICINSYWYDYSFLRDSQWNDSIDSEGNLVYCYRNQYLNSGVFNMKTNEWMYRDTFKSVYPTPKGLILESLDRNNFELSSSKFSFIGFDGEYKFMNEDYDCIIDNPEYLRLLIQEYPVDSFFGSCSEAELSLAEKNQYYFHSGEKLGICFVDEYWLNSSKVSEFVVLEPEEYIYYNDLYKYKFWLEGDSIFFGNAHFQVAVDRSNGKIIYEPRGWNSWDAYYGFECSMISGTDTIRFSKKSDSYDDYSNGWSSIEFSHGYLVVNDQGTVGVRIEPSEFDEEEFLIFDMERESSAIWSNKDGKWVKVSPYYASVLTLKNGFCVKTGYKYTTHPGGGLWETIIQQRFMLLDTNLTKIEYKGSFSFVSIVDLGFGLEIKLDNGNLLFMTYDFKPVTESDWDKFELRDGKLVAIKGGYALLDEYGDEIRDDVGDIVFKSLVEQEFIIP